MRMNKNGNAIQKPVDITISNASISFNQDLIIENSGGDLHINAKRIFINGKEFK